MIFRTLLHFKFLISCWNLSGLSNNTTLYIAVDKNSYSQTVKHFCYKWFNIFLLEIPEVKRNWLEKFKFMILLFENYPYLIQRATFSTESGLSIENGIMAYSIFPLFHITKENKI